MKPFIKMKVIALTILLVMLVAVNFSSAADFIKPDVKNNIGNNALNVGQKAGYESNIDLASVVGIVIQAFLGILGVIFLVYMLYAGYNWMIAQGDEERVTRAKDTIRRAIIGLIIIIAAYAISYWVFDRLLTTTNIIK